MKSAIKVTVLIVLTLSFMSTTVIAAEQYTCVAEETVGFMYNKATKEWAGAIHKTGNKYIISKPYGSHFAYQVIQVGRSVPISNCLSGFNDKGNLSCSGLSSKFRINNKSRRFLLFYISGYYSSDESNDDKSDTPYMEIGKCSPF